MKTKMIRKGNATIRVSIEDAYWNSLFEIAGREGMTADELCLEIVERGWKNKIRMAPSDLFRAFVIIYFQSAVSPRDDKPCISSALECGMEDAAPLQ